jgi:hypothetical protein
VAPHRLARQLRIDGDPGDNHGAGITAVTVFFCRSMALTVPAPTFEVYARVASLLSTTMCASGSGKAC